MADLETQVVVVGGGATGTAVLRDLALRGIDAVLVERADLGTGTSGRWHGLLHSGGRYVVKDPVSATECIEENMVLRRIAPHCIEDTGGLFVLLPENDQSYGDAFVEACAKTGVPCEELTPGEARRREPLLMPNLSRVFAVPDGTLDGWKLMGGFVADAKSQGARVLLRHPVVGFERDGDQIRAVRVRDAASGEDRLIGCQWVLNAAGAWAGQIATLAGGRLQMAPGKGAMVVMVGRYVRGVVNDCRMPGDGDIIVPVHEVAILGTTDVETDDPDDISVDPREVDFMIDSAAKMVPAVATGRVLRAFSGSRPLFKPEDAGGDSRDITRAFFVLDHSDREGPANLLSIVGGKLTPAGRWPSGPLTHSSAGWAWRSPAPPRSYRSQEPSMASTGSPTRWPRSRRGSSTASWSANASWSQGPGSRQRSMKAPPSWTTCAASSGSATAPARPRSAAGGPPPSSTIAVPARPSRWPTWNGSWRSAGVGSRRRPGATVPSRPCSTRPSTGGSSTCSPSGSRPGPSGSPTRCRRVATNYM
jgi:glycine/D-amino acid oxidase-like deaminating enzyme